eukprot:1669356-Amphidinium_carterae.1
MEGSEGMMKESQQLQSEVLRLRQGRLCSRSHTQFVDTKVLGKPDMFSGEGASWKDWSIVFRAYVEALAGTECTLAALGAAAAASRQLYLILLMLSKGAATESTLAAPGAAAAASRQLHLTS